MATVFRTTRMRRNRDTGKLEAVLGPDGAPVTHPRWRTVILDHRGRRKMFTLAAGKAQAQKQADTLEHREREIRNGILPPPGAERQERSFDEALDEYMAWGRIQGGRRGLPWDDEHAAKKERDLLFWRDALRMGDLGDADVTLPRVEAECRRMFQAGNSGKTVSNKVQNLRAMFLWCCRRGYMAANPLRELGRFNTDPTFTRRAMTLDEYTRLLARCAPHRRLLYETAVCSGLRANELRMLEPRDLDRAHSALCASRLIDKTRRERAQYIPASLMKRLSAFAFSGGAKKLYAELYRKQGARSRRNKPPAKRAVFHCFRGEPLTAMTFMFVPYFDHA